jgi:hypothetical protein
LAGAKADQSSAAATPHENALAVMLTERFDRFDHRRSAEQMSVTLQALDKAGRRIRCPADRCEEDVAIRADRFIR